MRDQQQGAGASRSPLYTSPAAKLAKKAFIAQHGKDRDGAYRTQGRIDKAGQKAAA